jgi:iron complex outermembrane receptor protein
LRRVSNTKLLLTAAASSLVLGLAAPAMAQTAAAPAQADSVGVAEVVVTSQRREEKLQKVPIAVTVLSGDQLAARQTFTTENLDQLVPSLTFRKGTTNVNSSLNIRGIGTLSFASGVEPAVSTVVDGVVLGRSGQAFFDFYDVARIEVLRGPQGTLFGKNASAGVVSIVTKAPSNTLTGFAEASAFEGHEYRVRGGVSGPITDTLRGSLTGIWGKYDGNATNVYNGKTVNGYDRVGGRGRLEWTPTNDVTVTLIGDYVNAVDSGSADVIGATTSAAGAYVNQIMLPSLAPLNINGSNRNIDNDFDPVTKDTNWGLSAQVDWRLGDYTLTSISAYRGWDNTENRDGDYRSDAPAYVYSATGASSGDTGSRDVGWLDFHQITQELRLASPTGGFFEYVVGAYYYHTDQDNFFNRTATRCTASTLATLSNGLTPCAPGSSTYAIAANGTAHWNTQLTNYAGFGQANLNFTPKFRAIVGARWSHDEIEYDFNRVAAVAGPGVSASYAGKGTTDASGWSGRAGLQYDFTPSVTGYVNYARGYKGPAINVFFNHLARDAKPLDPETSNAYEIGLKNQFFDRRLVLNLAAFKADYEGFQTNFYDVVAGTIVSRLINAGDVGTKGFEGDFQARPLKNLTLSGGFANVNARIKQFICPVGAPTTCADAVNGKPLAYAPKWKYNLAADYRIETPSLPFDIGLGAGYNWRSGTQYDINQSPFAVQPSYGLLDASVSLVDRDNRWKLSVVGRNLGDKFYTTARIVDGAGYVRYQIPRDAERYFGVTLRANFGS